MKITTIILAALLLIGPAFSQTDEETPKFYHLDLVVKESEAGKLVNSRNYSMSVSSSPRFNSNSSSVRTGEKIPVSNGNQGYSYTDVGTNIDCQVMKATDNYLIMHVTTDITSGSGNPPVITQNRWNATATVPFKKPTVIFSADAVSKRQMQLEVTVTPIQ